MTPQERQLVEQLFDKLATLEREPRDADAERAIREGLARAPNAVYALVQTALVQDEALRRANARIEEMEAAMGGEERQEGGFLDKLRNTMFGPDQRRGAGSVPSVRPGETDWRDERWSSGPPMGAPTGYGYGQGPGGPMSGPFGGGPGGPAGGGFGGGGSFLGTAAAAAAGVIGGSLLLNSIRGMMGPAHAGQGALDSGAAGGGRSPWGGGAGDSDLARQAGLDDVGGGGSRRMGAFDDPERSSTAYDRNASSVEGDTDYDDTDDGDFGGDGDFDTDSA
jgi:hypothetical protein